MKKRKKQQSTPPLSPPPQPPQEEERFTLEDILQEFGAPQPSGEQPTPQDPALQTPIPRHHTRDADPETQRYQPNVEDLPERHIPNQPMVEEQSSILQDSDEDWEEEPIPGPDLLGVKPKIPDAPAGSPAFPASAHSTGFQVREAAPRREEPAAPRKRKPATPEAEQPPRRKAAAGISRLKPAPEPGPSRRKPEPEPEPTPPRRRPEPEPESTPPRRKPESRPEPTPSQGRLEPVQNELHREEPPVKKAAHPSPEIPPAGPSAPPTAEPEHAPERAARAGAPGRPAVPFPEDRRKPPRRAKAPGDKKPPKPILTPEARFRQAGQEQKRRGIRLAVCLLFALCNLVLGFFHSQGLLERFQSQSLLVMGEILLMLLCACAAYDVLSDGLRQLLKPGFGFNTLVTVEILVSLADSFYAFQSLRYTYCPLVSLLLACALWGLRLRSTGTRDAMAPARHCSGETALVREPGLYQKTAGVLKGKGSMPEFLQANDRAAGPQLLLEFYGAAVLLISALIAGFTCGGDIPTFLQYWTAIALAGTPLLGSVAWYRPWAILNRRLQEQGASLYGWTGARRLCGKLAVPVSDQDLFPRDNIKLNGVKYYGGQAPDRVVAYGAAVIEAAGSGLAPLFQEQMEIRAARRYALTKFRRYESGGAGAEIGADSVLVGSLQFMQSMGVEMPAGTRVSQAVYVAINGSLAGVFAIHYGVTRSAAQSLGSLAASRGVLPVVTAGDFIISEPFLRSKFRVNTAKVKLPSLTVRSELAKRESSSGAKPCVLLQEYRFPAVALAVSGARALCTAVRWGTLVALAGGIMGMIIMGILASLSAPGIMSLANLGLFLLLWSVPGLLLSGWPRNV